ncbi:MAG TPA: hypothetical protein PKZ07_11730 [Sedimentisphaerales bacterium]|nr:hypothetical protein [Sedimentisphaerales bacterium]
MKTISISTIMTLSALCTALCSGADDAKRPSDSILRRTFDLAAPRSSEPQAFEMETRVLTYALDGKRVSTDVLKLSLTCTPGKEAGDADRYTCTRFAVQFGTGPEIELPAMAGWSYPFKHGGAGIDEKGQVFGIDHAKFEKLADANGKPLPVDKAYFVYNTFIDFHAFCNVFAEPVTEGKGIQDLKRLGDKIVHAAANTEAPVNLGAGIQKGSTFKNGEITLEFKGLSLVDNAPCAVVAYDSGESSFQMIVTPMPNMEVRSVGSSHYKGDIYVDLATRWVRKATMDELVVTETTVSGMANKINAVIERATTIRNVADNSQG